MDSWWAQTLGEAPLLTIYPLINYKPIACHTWSLYLVSAAWFTALPSAFIQFIRPSLQIETGKLFSSPAAWMWPNQYRQVLGKDGISFWIMRLTRNCIQRYVSHGCGDTMRGYGPSLVRDTHAWRTVKALHHCCAVSVTGFVRRVFGHTTVIKRVIFANVC
jgi:hypothetical protein